MNKHEAIRKALLDQREELNQRIHEITRDVRHQDAPLPSDFSEQATERENEEVMDALGAAGRQELSRLNRTLARIDAGEYGICASCGEPIPEARLEILPTSEYCVACAEKQGN
ncbi:MAG: TraR/DksA family transcriptional regulator [Gammaproteobacteria bacterium]|nr:TraR/DksA family transcriptional regulator [Gammaproteobacteria bacterium]